MTNFQLLGEIPLEWEPWIKSIDELENKDIPEPGELIKAQVVVWDADKCNLKLKAANDGGVIYGMKFQLVLKFLVS